MESTVTSLVSYDELIEGMKVNIDGVEGSLGTVNVVTGSSGNISNSVATSDVLLNLGFNCRDCWMREDGLMMYVACYEPAEVKQYSLSTAYTIATASYVGTGSFSNADGMALGVVLSPDGTKVFIAHSNGVSQFTLSTAWDITSISSGTAVARGSISASKVYGITFNSNGTKLYCATPSSLLSEINLSTAWDITSYTGSITSIDIAALSGNSQYNSGVSFSKDGKRLVMAYYYTDSKLAQFDLAAPWDISTAIFTTNYSIGFIPSYCTFMDNDTKFITRTDDNDDLKVYTTDFVCTKYTADITSFSLAATPKRVFAKGGETLDFVSSTLTEYVGTNAKSGLIETGDSIQLDGVTDVVCSSVVESGTGPYTYTCTIPSQVSAPTSAKVLDRSVTPTEASDVYDNVNDKFIKTYSTIEQEGRAMKYKIEADEGVEVTKLSIPMIKKA